MINLNTAKSLGIEVPQTLLATAGWGLDPLESAAFARRTPIADIGRGGPVGRIPLG
jgi:hypothetical protein